MISVLRFEHFEKTKTTVTLPCKTHQSHVCQHASQEYQIYVDDLTHTFYPKRKCINEPCACVLFSSMSINLRKAHNAYYLLGSTHESQKMLEPISGYAGGPLLSLEEACEPLLLIVCRLSLYVSRALENSKSHGNSLTRDESAAIRLYTMEWDRVDNMADGAKFPWWGFSSCTTSLDILEFDIYMGKVGKRTLFSIESFNGRRVSNYSDYPTEDEILLLPGTHFEVMSQLNPAQDLWIIHLKQKMPPYNLLEEPFEGKYKSRSLILSILDIIDGCEQSCCASQYLALSKKIV
ncbi:unnamed protein product [Rotaria socialis]